jgi:hypothetical protein
MLPDDLKLMGRQQYGILLCIITCRAEMLSARKMMCRDDRWSKAIQALRRPLGADVHDNALLHGGGYRPNRRQLLAIQQYSPTSACIH